MKRTNNVDLNAAPLKIVRTERALSDKEKYLSILKEWEDHAPTGENRTEVANQLRECVDDRNREFELYDSNITVLPPLPPRVTSLVITDCSDFMTWPNNLSQLIKVRIAECDNFTTLPDNLSQLTSLEVSNCPGFTEVPDNLSQLTELYIDGCPSFTGMPENLSQLTKLYIDCCPSFTTVPHNLFQLTELDISCCRNFTTVPDNLSQLTKLKIRDCANFTTMPDDLVELIVLDINVCNNFTTVPENLFKLTSLDVYCCANFTTMPDNLSQLTELRIWECANFTTMPDNLSQLTELSILQCDNFTTMPDNLSQLTEFNINSCNKLTALPVNLPQLIKLSISHCDNFTIIPDNLSQLTELYINSCNKLTALPVSLSQLTKLRISQCANFTTMPNNLSQLTVLDINSCNKLTALPVSLPQLASLNINNSPRLTRFPSNLPANLKFSGDRFGHSFEYVLMWLHIKTAYWANAAQEIAGFKEYCITRMWNTREAQTNPAAFRQKQLNLLQQIDNDPELRQACLDLAVIGSANCHDNALAMFQQMQEKALDIAMYKPNVPVHQLIAYGLALENKAKLMQLIEDKPELKQGINGGEGTEAQLALQLLCHQKNITLPIPVTAMCYEPTGWEQFRKPEDGQVTAPIIKYGIGKLIEYVIPRNAKPSAAFLAAQPFWQACVGRLNPAISEQIDVIETTATEKLDIENEKLFGGGDASITEIEQNMKAIEQERLAAIAHLYLKETVRLLG